MTEDDWHLVAGWWNDPEISYYADAESREYKLPQVQEIVREISMSAYCFIIEYKGKTVGDCWLQVMNLDRVLALYPHLDCRRIDLEIEKAYWGRGVCTAAIRLLTDFGSVSEGADAIFGMDVDDQDVRSRRAFERAGFAEHSTGIHLIDGREQGYFDFVIRRPGVT